MGEYPLRLVEAMVANGCGSESIDDFIEGRTQVSEEVRSAVGALAWAETSRENRRQRVAELMEGKRQFAGRVSAKNRVGLSWADEAVAGADEIRLGIGP